MKKKAVEVAAEAAKWIRNQADIVEIRRQAGHEGLAQQKEEEIRGICRIINEAIIDTLEVIDAGDERERRVAG